MNALLVFVILVAYVMVTIGAAVISSGQDKSVKQTEKRREREGYIEAKLSGNLVNES